MQRRFVVVPAFPVEKETFPRRLGLLRTCASGFDLYDTQDKARVVLNLPTRTEAEGECAHRNHLQAAPAQ